MQSEPETQNPIRIGTRGSKLALVQAHQLRDRLMAAHGLTEEDFDFAIIKTSGDIITDQPLAAFGGKGLFTKEIEEALIADEIDVAVHSAKDMTSTDTDGLVVGAYLPREDPRDALCGVEEIRAGMRIGCKVTLRGERMYDFLDKLFNVTLPRVRDFGGISPNSFDGHGNFAMGMREQLTFPEIEYDRVDRTRGMDIIIGTTARTDQEARALLKALGLPFRERENK